MINSSLLGSRIENARKKKKLSQAKLAELVGVSRASISLYETSTSNPSYKVLVKLADTLATPFVELAGLGDGGDDYAGAMITQQILHSSNEDRAGFIKHHLKVDEAYIEIPFLNTTSTDLDNTERQTSGHLDKHVQWPSVSVLVVPGKTYEGAIVYIIQDNKMGTRYPASSRHILHPIFKKDSWQYLTGTYGITITEGMTIIRRIISNKEDILTLADAAGNETIILMSHLSMIWSIGQTIHMPAEN